MIIEITHVHINKCYPLYIVLFTLLFQQSGLSSVTAYDNVEDGTYQRPGSFTVVETTYETLQQQ